MKASLLTLLIGILGFTYPKAQNDIPIIQSEVLDNENTQLTNSLLEADSTGYYVLRFEKKMNAVEIEHYDTNLVLVKKYPVTEGQRPYAGVLTMKKKWYLLCFNYKKNEEKKIFEQVSLFANVISRKTFRLEKDSITLIRPFKMESKSYRGNFTTSPDDSKILVYDYEEDDEVDHIKGLTDKINLRVFDSRLQLLWERKVHLGPVDKTRRMVVIKKLRVSNEGEVAILTDIFRDKRSYEIKEITADPTLFFVGKEREKFSRYTPSLGNYYYNQLNFTFDDEGNVIWFGFYSRQRYYQQAGVFYIKINKNRTKVLVKKQHTFQKEYLMEIMSRRRMPKMIEPRAYKLVHWHRSAEGDITISAEYQPHGVYNFKSHGVMLIKMDNLGEIVWKRYVYKSANYAQKFRKFLSHYLFVQDGNTYMVYNNGIYPSGFARIIRIDSEGRMRRRIFLLYQNQNELYIPALSRVLSRNRLFLGLEDRFFQSYCFGVLDYAKIFESDSDRANATP